MASLEIKLSVVEPGNFRTDWAGRSTSDTPVVISDYADRVGVRMTASKDRRGKQQGDPVRGCEAIINAVENGNHLRLLLGKMAYDFATEKMDSMKENFIALKELCLSADFLE